jgi:hypothetical protein
MDTRVDEVMQPPPASLAIRPDDFRTWLQTAGPGARIEYHRGCLALDRADAFGRFTVRQRAALCAVAEAAAAQAAVGRLLLVQERHGEGDYSYFAVKPKHPARKEVR